MTVQLNHTIVHSPGQARRPLDSSRRSSGRRACAVRAVLVVSCGEVSLDFADERGPVTPQHYAFLVGEPEFDAIFGRIRERGLDYWADPFRRRAREINTNDGGRGVYWLDPNGHILEIITRPYGG